MPTNPHSASVSPQLLLWVVALWLMWGTNWMLFPLAVREVSVWNFRAVSMVGAGVLLLLLARARGMSLSIPRGQRVRAAAAALIYLAVWNIASTYAAVLIPSGQAALLGFTMPLWVALFSFLAFGERLTPRLQLALALGAAGVALLMGASLQAYAQAPLGVALGLLAGMAWAIGTLVLKRGGGVTVPALVLTGWQMLIAAVPVCAGALYFAQVGTQGGPPSGLQSGFFLPSWQNMALIAYITIVPMALGNLAWFAIVGRLPAQVAGLSSVMVPMVAMVAGALVHREPLGLPQWAAMACCSAALLLALFNPMPRADKI